MKVEKTLAYKGIATITAGKSFIIQAPASLLRFQGTRQAL